MGKKALMALHVITLQLCCNLGDRVLGQSNIPVSGVCTTALISYITLKTGLESTFDITTREGTYQDRTTREGTYQNRTTKEGTYQNRTTKEGTYQDSNTTIKVNTFGDRTARESTYQDTTIRESTRQTLSSVEGTVPWSSVTPSSPTQLCLYNWNRTVQSPEEYLLGYCLQRCSSFKASQTICKKILLCANLDCFPCTCSDSCKSLGTCCLDSPNWGLQQKDATGCLQDGTTAIVKCSVQTNDTVRRKCEDVPSALTPQDVPVTDIATNATYKNEHCALCNNVVSYKSWTLQILCTHFQYLYSALTDEEFIARAKLLPNLCTFEYYPPVGVQRTVCSSQWFAGVVTTCNVSGLWSSYDEEIRANCLRYTSLSLRVKEGKTTYQNMFCAICNGVRPQRYNKCDAPNQGDRVVVSPLTFLLGLKQTKNDVHEFQEAKCLPSQWADFNSNCRNITCSAGKVIDPINNYTCTTALPQIIGLVYKLNITLEPASPLFVNSSGSDHDKEIAAAIFKEFFLKTKKLIVTPSSLDVYLYKTNVTSPPSNGSTEIVKVRLTGYFKGMMDERDLTEKNLVKNLLMTNWSLIWTVPGPVNVSAVFRRSADAQIKEMFTHDLQINWTSKVSYNNTAASNVTISDNSIIELSPLLVCAYVEFEMSEFVVQLQHNNQKYPLIILLYEDSEVVLEDLRQLRLNGYKLQVCFESLINLTISKYYRSNIILFGQYILSTVAILLSVVCLILTLTVYILLPALRTQPGLNVMGTCVTLLVAQVTLLLASHDVVSGIWCTALGILLHLSWLNNFCWTSVCTWHMFRAFSANTPTGPRAVQYSELARNVTITNILPAAVVILVVVGSFFQSGGRSIGYGSHACYLDSTLLVGLTLVLPISLVVVFNLMLFGLTVREINQVRMLQVRLYADSRHESRRYLYICARLSVLTGTMWVLSVLAEGLDVVWLRYMSIIANGGQGILVFVSYVVNRRVGNRLFVWLGIKSHVASHSRILSITTRVTDE